MVTGEKIREKRWPAFAIGLMGAAWLAGDVRGQDPGNTPLPGAEVTAHPLSEPSSPPPVAVSDPTPTREEHLEDRVRHLEATIQRMAGQMNQLTAPTSQPSPVAGPAPEAAKPPATPGALAPGQRTTIVPSPSDAQNMPPANRKDKLSGTFGPGFMLNTDDEEYVLQFHDLTQIEGRFYEQGGQDPVRDTFAIPRQWYLFSGRITKPYEYLVSLQQSFDAILPLDVFLNVNYDQRLQFKVGRFKTPFTYEFYQLPIQGLINPERSLFFNNFALNRQVGAQVWGQLFDQRLDYSAGIFNTLQNGNVDFSDGKDFLGYLGFKPFLLDKDSPLQYLNVGGSVDVGNQNNAPVPQTLRTQVPTTGSSTIGIPFLAFNNNIRQAGQHTLWSLHAAWYYKQLSLVSEWQSGFQNYAPTTALQDKTNLPIDSFYVQAGYFLTGETVAMRGMVKPLRPFDPRKGQRGPGAFELATRYNHLELGDQVFSHKLADRKLWTNDVYTTDLGLNWYPNQYLKLILNWEHAGFGDPVRFAPDRRQLTSDTFWFRFQLYF